MYSGESEHYENYVACILSEGKEKENYLAKDINVKCFRNQEEKLRKYFTKIDDPSVSYFNDVQGLMDKLKPGIYKDEK